MPMSVDDRAILESFYVATRGKTWRNRNNWLSDEPLPLWNGVAINAKGRVTTLDLHDNHLKGQIPAVLGRLDNLERLLLHNNELMGKIPTELGGLVGLQWLVLGDNRLAGGIPMELGNLTNLQSLYLGNVTRLVPFQSGFVG